jgi:hypothetical protein
MSAAARRALLARQVVALEGVQIQLKRLADLQELEATREATRRRRELVERLEDLERTQPRASLRIVA